MWVARRATYAPGSSGPFTPKSLPGLLAWYDASQIAAADNTPLAAWDDLSGNGFTMSQATAADQPTYYSSTAGKTVNGLPAVWFDGVDDVMTTAAPWTSAVANVTMFVVCQDLTSGGTLASPFNGTAALNGYGIAIRANGNNLGWLAGHIAWESTATPGDANLHCLTWAYDTSAVVLRQDGVDLAAPDSSVIAPDRVRVDW